MLLQKPEPERFDSLALRIARLGKFDRKIEDDAARPGGRTTFLNTLWSSSFLPPLLTCDGTGCQLAAADGAAVKVRYRGGGVHDRHLDHCPEVVLVLTAHDCLDGCWLAGPPNQPGKK